MTIYHHVASKEEILDGMVERVFSEIELPPPELDWRGRDPRPLYLRPTDTEPPPLGPAPDGVAYEAGTGDAGPP